VQWCIGTGAGPAEVANLERSLMIILTQPYATIHLKLESVTIVVQLEIEKYAEVLWRAQQRRCVASRDLG